MLALMRSAGLKLEARGKGALQEAVLGDGPHLTVFFLSRAWAEEDERGNTPDAKLRKQILVLVGIHFEDLDLPRVFRGELVDRFGEPPAPVEHLLLLTGLKIDAMLWGIVSIYLEDQFVVLRGEAPVRLAQLAKTHKGRVRLVDERHCYLPLPQKVIPTAQLYRLIKSVLQPAK